MHKNVLKEQKENMSWKKYVENMKDLIVESTRNMVWVAMASANGHRKSKFSQEYMAIQKEMKRIGLKR